MTKKTTTELDLPADATLTQDHFEIDSAGNLVIKNQELADVLKRNLPSETGEASAPAVHVSVGIDV